MSVNELQALTQKFADALDNSVTSAAVPGAGYRPVARGHPRSMLVDAELHLPRLITILYGDSYSKPLEVVILF